MFSLNLELLYKMVLPEGGISPVGEHDLSLVKTLSNPIAPSGAIISIDRGTDMARLTANINKAHFVHIRRTIV